MSEYKYTKSYTADFGSILRNDVLVEEIEADVGITPTCLRVDQNGDIVDIVFDSEPSAGEKTIIDSLVAAHFTLPFVAENMNFMTIDATYSPFKIKRQSLKCDTAGGNITVNLVKAARVKNACFIIHKIVAANTVTIDPHGSETIGGNATHVLSALDDYVHFQSDGSNWNLIVDDNPLPEATNILRATITDRKGEFVVDDGSMLVGFPVGADGEILMADSATSTGLAYAGLSSISGYVANEHIDHSAVTLTAGVCLTGGGDLTTNRTFDLDITSLVAEATVDGASDYVVVYDASATAHRKVLLNDLPATGGGETNAGANVGTGSGWYRDKTGTTLNFKSLISGSNKLSIASNTNDLTVDVVPANIDHDLLLGFVAAEHIDWTQDAGASNIHDANIVASSITQHESSITHQNLSGAGTNTHAQIDTHLGSTSNPHSVTKAQVGLSDVPNLKQNLAASTAPTATDDSGSGYAVGSRWIDTVADKEYVCLDATATSAVWTETTSGAGGGEANTASSAGGTSLVKAKVGVDLPFKGLTATSTKISLSANTNDVGIDVTEANLTLNNIGGTLGVAKGGTNLTSYTIGDLVYASGATTLAKLADVATGNSLISGGIGVAPSWGKVGLTTHVSGTLAVANGGTGASSLAAGNILRGNGTGAITATLAAPSGAIVGTTDVQTLTNKTLTATSNNVAAKSLHSATTVVDISAATAPTTGQVLTATSSTTATWQTPSGGGGSITNSTVSATADTSTTSVTYTVIDSMTTTPASGTYLITFSASGSASNGGADCMYAIHTAGSINSHSTRHLAVNGGGQTNGYTCTLHTQAVVTVNGSETVDVRYQTSIGNFLVYARSMILLKLA